MIYDLSLTDKPLETWLKFFDADHSYVKFTLKWSATKMEPFVQIATKHIRWNEKINE
jgi:hypothetical protein